MVRGLDPDSLDKMSSLDFVLAIDLLRNPLKELNRATKIPLKRLRKFAEEAKRVCYD